MGVVDMIGTLSFEAPGGGIACLNVTVPAPRPPLLLAYFRRWSADLSVTLVQGFPKG